jgi:hypothetical protein
VKELCRVAKRVFVSVPNRFFPVEHHTAMPLAHYLDGTFRIAIAAPAGRSAAVGYTGLLLGPLSSNLYLSLS